MSLNFIIAAIQGNSTPPPDPEPPISVEEVVADPGGVESYLGFPYAGKLANGYNYSLCKQAVSHVDTGPLLFSVRKEDGWESVAVNVGGTPILVSALTANVMASGRLLVVYQDNDGSIPGSYQEIKTLYSDDNGETWNYGDSYDFNDPDYGTSILGRPIQLPSGKVLIPYYRIPSAGEGSGLPSFAAYMVSEDEGQTFTLGGTILERTGGAAPNGYTTEIGWCILDGTTDSNTRIVALIRNEQYQYHTHVRSDDGGETWTADTTNFFYMIEGGVPNQAKFPVDLIIYNGVVYIVAGVRAYNGPDLISFCAYKTIDPENFFNNVQAGYSERVDFWDALATTMGSETDFGYNSTFIDHHGQLVTIFYDTSPLPSDSGNKRVRIYQLPITTTT